MSKVAILALTSTGIKLAKEIRQIWNKDAQIFVSKDKVEEGLSIFPTGKFTTGIQLLFKQYDALVCIMATGIVVRSIADVLEDKQKDPAVIVLDEKGRHTISLLSGHIGGGNQLTLEIAAKLNSCPVITTATDIQEVTALDILSKTIDGWYSDFKETTKKVNSLLANHKKVGLIQHEQWVKDTRGLTVIKENDAIDLFDAVLLISDKYEEKLSKKIIQVVPRRYVLGIGAKKDCDFSIIQKEYLSFCKSVNVHYRSIKKMVSIDLKKEEPGIVRFSEWLDVSFETYSAEELSTVSGKYPESSFVKQVTGVGNVSLSAADLASNGQVVTGRYASHGVTFALGKDEDDACCMLWD
ncbi:cobalt-precorrin 5A hydrolase [Candidatus Enterococcus murrayae]|uniref:Cobalt-precorrin 5A hydrolase n=1 Tax=Candidatus Enterococcus murrayae TaxID=2815321 RepID=A0ABS3HFB4_9ENTE|nr:cobalt-precorrin 5A hydrolase [Enterococcus sp. MJM16]MBO0452141.1 cobalt-precorrin 5A hydrolase [Enterococcus sp. MJM16]